MSTSEPAMTRESVLKEIDSTWNDLQTYLASLTEDQLTRPTDAAGWTVKDHVIHIAMWENASVQMLEGKPKRETLDIPQEVWDEGEDPINAVLQQRYHDVPWPEVIQTVRQTHAAMMKKLDTLTEADFQRPYSHYQPQSTDERPIILWVQWDTAHHFLEHMPWMAAISEKE